MSNKEWIWLSREILYHKFWLADAEHSQHFYPIPGVPLVSYQNLSSIDKVSTASSAGHAYSPVMSMPVGRLKFEIWDEAAILFFWKACGGGRGIKVL
jgi:hypothetical protein